MSEADTYGPTLRKLAANISLASALVLVAVKLLGWLATGFDGSPRGLSKRKPPTNRTSPTAAAMA